MAAAKDITTILTEYQEKLGKLNTELAEAERRGIQLDTELKTLEKERDKMVKECEEVAGVPYSQVENVLNEKVKELSALLKDFDGINCDVDTMTEEDIKKLNNLTAKYVTEG